MEGGGDGADKNSRQQSTGLEGPSGSLSRGVFLVRRYTIKGEEIAPNEAANFFTCGLISVATVNIVGLPRIL